MVSFSGGVLVSFLFCVCNLVSGGKILILHPIYSGSHVLTLSTVAEAMTQRGHQVRIVRWKDAHGSYSAHNNPNISSTTLAMDNSHGLYPFLTQEKQATFQVPFGVLWDSGMKVKMILELYRGFSLLQGQCETLLSNKGLIKELREENFDVAIIDILYNECGLVLLDQLKIPTVGYWAFPFASGEADVTTAFLPPSHVPQGLSGYSDHMSFRERFCNTLGYAAYRLIMLIQCHNIHQVAKSHYADVPHPMDLIKNLNGMLINTDYALDYPRLLPPTFVNVGGMQIRDPRPLPQEIEDWIQSSGEHGVILFTMGFIFNPRIMPAKLTNAFMKAFSLLPQKVLMKFDGELEYVPPNVKVLTWIPQQDVLAHPKTRVFLTHCGLHGVMEAIYYAVPMVGMPIFLDQGDVLSKMETKGIAVGFSKDNVTWEEIHRSLKLVLSDRRYKDNVEKLSRMMHDVKETPLERAAELLEYIMRHDGAEHLKLNSRNLNFFQYFCLDVIAAFFGILLATVYVSFRILRLIVRGLISTYDKQGLMGSSASLLNKLSLAVRSRYTYLEKKIK